MTKHIIVLFSLALLVSCHQTSDSNGSYHEVGDLSFDVVKEQSEQTVSTAGNWIEPPRTAEPTPPPQSKAHFAHLTFSNNGPNQVASTTKAQNIIKQGRISINVDDLQKSKTELDQLVSSVDGYYESESFQNGYNSNEFHLVIRIPVDGFTKLTASLDGDFGKISSKEINAKDVTEEYVDLGIRLESKLVALAAYQKFLKRATNVEEILKVQNEIRHIEEEIESKKGRLKYLDDQIAYSTLRINLVQDIPVIAKADVRHFGAQIQSAFVSGYDGILSFVIAMIYVWPLWVLLIGLWAVWRWRKSKFVIS